LRKTLLIGLSILLLAVLATAGFRSMTSGERFTLASAPQIWALNGSDDTTTVIDGNGWATTKWLICVGACDSNTAAIYDSFVLMEGDESDGSDLAAVTSTGLVYGSFLTSATGTIAKVDTASEGDQIYTIEYRNNAGKRYSAIKVVQTGNHSGSGDGTYLSIVAIRHFAETNGAADY